MVFKIQAHIRWPIHAVRPAELHVTHPSANVQKTLADYEPSNSGLASFMLILSVPNIGFRWDSKMQ